MSDAGETTFVFKGNTKPAEESLDQFGIKVENVAKKLGVALAGYLSFRAVMGGLDKAIDSAMEAEKAVNQLNFALSSSGKYSEEASQSFQDYAQNLQNTTGVSDELIISNAALLVSIGKLSGGALQDATKAALDLAAGMQIDVASAFDIVTKATQGNVMALNKYGLEVSKTATDAQKFGAALEFINSHFGGQAESQTLTFEGSLRRLSNSFGDMFEEIGKLLTRSPEMIGLFRAISSEIESINKKISNTNGSSFINSTINGALAFSYAVATVIERFGSLIASVAGVFNYLIYGVSGPLVQVVGFLSQKLGDFLSILGPSLGDGFSSVGDSIKKTGEEMTAFANGSIAMAGDQIKNVFSGLTESTGGVSQSIIDFQNTYTTEVDKVLSSSKKLSDGIDTSNKKVTDSTIKYGSILVSSFASSMQHFAKQLAGGKGLFENFGSFILNLLGDLSIQMGTMMMTAGLGMLAMKYFDPTGMIIGGAALIAVGSLLKAFFGSSGDGQSQAGQAPGSSPGDPAYTSSTMSPTPLEDRVTPQTGVQVIVQGNVFDSKETGLQIAQILSDSFDTNGTIVRGFA